MDRARWDAVMVLLTAAQAAALLVAPSGPLIALGLWWNANTVAHNFIHRPFFGTRPANRAFAASLSVLLGFPLALWRDRHLAHHAGLRPRLRASNDLMLQAALVLLLWTTMAARAPGFFLVVYVPGYLTGLALCALHGYYEHARGTTSYYGTLYNVLFFNDGYHVEHHAHPGVHWTRLQDCRGRACSAPARSEIRLYVQGSAVSAWPAPIRWMEVFGLESLERLVLRSPALQRFVLSAHRQAFRQLVGRLSVDRIAIVGGGLFPRTALVLRELLPDARITIIDASETNLDRARAILETAPELPPSPRLRRVSPKLAPSPGSGGGKLGPTWSHEYVQARYPQTELDAFDLVVFPLSLDGCRDAVYAQPPARAVIVHDWLWRPRGESRVVSLLLLKRINLVFRARARDTIRR